MKALPQDQAQRERFARELDKNFSVIAAAGAGKTTAITDRIVEIAQNSDRAREWFPRLAVVTFTNRAADEMQQRARQRIFEQNVSPTVLAAFNRAFKRRFEVPPARFRLKTRMAPVKVMN